MHPHSFLIPPIVEDLSVFMIMSVTICRTIPNGLEKCVCVTSKQQQAAFKPSFYDIFMSESKPTLNKLDGQKSNLCQKDVYTTFFLAVYIQESKFQNVKSVHLSPILLHTLRNGLGVAGRV